MAKTPRDGIDEDAIIKRRDGAADPGSEQPLDAAARRALADARLWALAFALGTAPSRRTGAADADDGDLLAYLLDALSEPRRIALENELRGDARAFGRLMTLRAALDSWTDERDRHRADDPARQIPRHEAGRFAVRCVGDTLQFKEIVLRPQADSLERSVLRAAAASAEVHRAMTRDILARFDRPPLHLNPNTAALIDTMLERAKRDVHAVTRLIEEMQSLLHRWQERERWSDYPSKMAKWGKVEPLEQQLQHLLERLETTVQEAQKRLLRFAADLDDELDHSDRVAAAWRRHAKERTPPEKADELSALRAASSALPRADWADAVDVVAGPWEVRLSGTARPHPELVVSVRANEVPAASTDPFLTLVRPETGFETVPLDSSGSGKVALPAGQSVMLLQADEVWEIRLSFLGRQGA